MLVSAVLLGLWLSPAVLDTKSGPCHSYGWPIKQHLVWVYGGGRYRDESGLGVWVIVFDVAVCAGLLWLTYWCAERVANHWYAAKPKE